MVPVTIASVDPRQEGGDLVVGWTTTMEQANAGFHVLGDLGGGWERLNGDLIPSQAVDSDEPLAYSARFPAVVTDRILIEDVDIRGRTQRHGPFEVGRRHGAEPEVQRVDRAAMRATNEPALGIAPMMATTFALEPVSVGADAARLSVTESGIQRITHAELLDAGVDLTGKPLSAIGIADNGRAVSRYVDDANGNEVFDAGDAIEFVGDVELTLYSDANLYVLTSDGSKVADARELAPSARGDVARTYTASYRAYPDNRYSARAPVGSIPWYDGEVRAIGKPGQLVRTFDLPDLDAAASVGATLSVDLWGLSDLPGADDHHAVVSLNGVEIADTRFDGLVLDRVSVDLDPAILRVAGNELVVYLPFDIGPGRAFDLVGLDGFALSYPAFALAKDGSWTGELPAGGAAMAVDGFADCAGLHLWGQHGNRPYRLTGLETAETSLGCQVTLPSRRNKATRYWLAAVGAAHRPAVEPEVPERTARARLRTEYLIITHPMFADSLGDLVALQESRGLTTEVVTTDAIYAAYSDHQRDADALQAFIRNSAKRSSSRLRYLLLVGGDTPDYFDVRGAEARTLVPTRYAKVGDLFHFAPTDVPYGDVDADGLPDIPTGRLIVRTIFELEAVVAKLNAYSGARAGLFVTGRSDTGNGFAEQHEAMSQVLADTGWDLADLAVDEFFDNGLGTADARLDLIDQLQLGYPLVSYLGHSDYDYWDFGPLFRRTDIASLAAGHPPFVVTQWGCWNSYFIAINFDTMAHGLLLTEGRGAASLIGTSSRTSLTAHDAIGRRFFGALSEGPIALGDALLRAQREAVAQSDSFRDDILAVVLLGDPALVIGH